MSISHESSPKPHRSGPRLDLVGLAFFLLHVIVGSYILFGWTISSLPVLALYLLVLPAVLMQWYFNRSSCVLNNVESWFRYGRWRARLNPEEGRFLFMLCRWLFGIRPQRVVLNRLSYVTVFFLWLLGALHLSWLTDWPADLLALSMPL